MQTPRGVVNVHPLSNYSFGHAPARFDKAGSAAERQARMQERYAAEGARRTVEGIILVTEHNHPHVLLLQARTHTRVAVDGGVFTLPGGKLKPGEDEVEGLKRKLRSKLAPAASSVAINWEVGECVANWWRPDFEAELYPYVPPHITRPKESKRVFVVHLPEKCYFAVPKNLKLLAVPLFELYQNERYGQVIASVPVCLSRFHINLLRTSDDADAKK